MLWPTFHTKIRIPEKINGRWVLAPFAPTAPAFNYPNFRGQKSKIYVVSVEGFTKIGISQHFEKRLRAIDTSIPYRIEKVATRTVPLSGAAYAEAWLHKKFQDRRHKGEWFAVPFEEVRKLMQAAVNRAVLFDKYSAAWYEAAE